METFSFLPPLNLVEEGKWLLAVTSSEAANSVFSKKIENNSNSINIPGHCNSKTTKKTIDELLELRSQNDNDLHVEEVKKRRNQKKRKQRL